MFQLWRLVHTIMIGMEVIVISSELSVLLILIGRRKEEILINPTLNILILIFAYRQHLLLSATNLDKARTRLWEWMEYAVLFYSVTTIFKL